MYIEIKEYRARDGSLSACPEPGSLEQTGELSYLFSYTDGVLKLINDHEIRLGLECRSCAGVLICEGQLMPNGARPGVFFTIHSHPTEHSDDVGASANKIWFPLGFEERDTDCILHHLGPSNHLLCNPHAVEPIPSWLKLFTGTTHISQATDRDNALCVLSGPPEILWGLVALSIGDISNLSAYITPRDQGLSLNWLPDREPDRTPRVLAVKIYRDARTPLSELEKPIQLV